MSRLHRLLNLLFCHFSLVLNGQRNISKSNHGIIQNHKPCLAPIYSINPERRKRPKKRRCKMNIRMCRNVTKNMQPPTAHFPNKFSFIQKVDYKRNNAKSKKAMRHSIKGMCNRQKMTDFRRFAQSGATKAKNSKKYLRGKCHKIRKNAKHHNKPSFITFLPVKRSQTPQTMGNNIHAWKL